MAAEMKDMDYEKMGFSKEEFEQANQMFAAMMGDMNAAGGPQAAAPAGQAPEAPKAEVVETATTPAAPAGDAPAAGAPP